MRPSLVGWRLQRRHNLWSCWPQRNSVSVLQNFMSICKIVWANLNSVEYMEYVLKETEPKCEVAFEHEGNVLFTVWSTHEFIKLWKGQAPRTNNSCSKATEHFEWFCFLGTPFKNKMQNSSFASFWDFPFFIFGGSSHFFYF